MLSESFLCVKLKIGKKDIILRQIVNNTVERDLKYNLTKLYFETFSLQSVELPVAFHENSSNQSQDICYLKSENINTIADAAMY